MNRISRDVLCLMKNITKLIYLITLALKLILRRLERFRDGGLWEESEDEESGRERGGEREGDGREYCGILRMNK